MELLKIKFSLFLYLCFQTLLFVSYFRAATAQLKRRICIIFIIELTFLCWYLCFVFAFGSEKRKICKLHLDQVVFLFCIFKIWVAVILLEFCVFWFLSWDFSLRLQKFLVRKVKMHIKYNNNAFVSVATLFFVLLQTYLWPSIHISVVL